MSECTCHRTPESTWTTHYGAVEPGSTMEPDPDCAEHFPRQVIPDAAVEAAWRVSLRNDVTRADIQKILEAAAPHMLKQAWNEGHGAGQIDPYCLDGNPYDPRDRTTK